MALPLSRGTLPPCNQALKNRYIQKSNIEIIILSQLFRSCYVVLITQCIFYWHDAIYVSLTLFSLVLYVICFFFSFFFFLEQILPNFFYFSSSWPTSISFLHQRCRVFYRILICGNYNQVVLSCLCILKNISASKTFFFNFD